MSLRAPGIGRRARLSGMPRLELRDPAAVANYWQRAVACLAGLGVASILLLLDPRVSGDSLAAVWRTTLGTALGASQLLQLSIGLVLTGCAFAIAFRARIWNIGMEGQLLMGAWASTFVAFHLPELPAPALIPLTIAAGMAGGAVYALGPALLKAYLQVNEIITTLMLNILAMLWLAYWVTGPWQRAQGSQTLESDAISENAHLGTFSVGGVVVGYGLVIAIVVALLLAALLRFTLFGYRMKFIGSNAKVAKYAGVSTRRYTVLILMLSGSIAGLAGALILMNYGHRYSVALTDNTGYLGIVIGAAAAGSMLGSIAMALLVGLLVAAGTGLRIHGVSGDAVMLLVGVVLAFLALSDLLARYRLRRSSEDRPGKKPRA